MVTAARACHPTQDVVPAEGARVVAIVGPPNCGKSTLFNRLTGLRQKVANFPGVTVEQHTGIIPTRSGKKVLAIDLPGIYSLAARSEDEQVTVDVLSGRIPGTPKPDVAIVVLDAGSLHRHLALAAAVIGLGIRTLVVLNMADSLRANGGHVDVLALARELGTPVILASATKGEGVADILEYIETTGHPAPNMPLELAVLGDPRHCREWAHSVTNRVGFRRPATPEWTRKLDSIFLHKLWGPIIFALAVVAVFQSIFTLAQPATDAMDAFLSATGVQLGTMLPEGLIRSAVIEGAWAGFTAVVVFLPQILLLFLIIGILEDSGYLGRAAVIADRVMAKLGLTGKAFIPLLSAYACAVPAIMATRTIENKRDRFATILVAPFMTCSARLPVYTMVIAAFIPQKPLLGPFFGTRAAAMLGLYLLGFLAALATARVLKSSILKSDAAPFIMELPPYRWPTLRSLSLRLLDRGRAFIVRAGTIILGMSLLIWAFTHLPLKDGAPPPLHESVAAQVGHAMEPVIEPLGFNWKVGVGLVTSLAAREVIVGTLGTLYGVDPENGDQSLQEAIKRDLTPAAAVALLVFFAFAMQCVSTLAIVRRETNSWRWPMLQFAYMTTLAYCAALAANQLLSRLL